MHSPMNVKDVTLVI